MCGPQPSRTSSSLYQQFNILVDTLAIGPYALPKRVARKQVCWCRSGHRGSPNLHANSIDGRLKRSQYAAQGHPTLQVFDVDQLQHLGAVSTRNNPTIQWIRLGIPVERVAPLSFLVLHGWTTNIFNLERGTNSSHKPLPKFLHRWVLDSKLVRQKGGGHPVADLCYSSDYFWSVVADAAPVQSFPSSK